MRRPSLKLLAAVAAVSASCVVPVDTALASSSASAATTTTATATSSTNATTTTNPLGTPASSPAPSSAQSNNTTVCGTYVCEIVNNQAQGSDYVNYVEVYKKGNLSYSGTYAYLVNSQVRASINSSGAFDFILDYNVNTGNCVAGQISGLGNSGCWYAP